MPACIETFPLMENKQMQTIPQAKLQPDDTANLFSPISCAPNSNVHGDLPSLPKITLRGSADKGSSGSVETRGSRVSPQTHWARG